MSIFEMGVDTMIGGMVDGLLPENQGKALYVALDVRRSAYDSKESQEYGASRSMHFIVTKPTNYVRVYCAVREDWLSPRPDEYKLQSEHDSCWRTDGFRMLQKVWGILDSELDQQGAPKSQRRDYCGFRLSSNPALVKVEEKRNITHGWGAPEDRCVLLSISKA